MRGEQHQVLEAVKHAQPLTCPYCGGPVVGSVKLGLTAEVGSVGPQYQGKFLFTGTEPLRADLCGACGTVVRLFVANPARPWITAE